MSPNVVWIAGQTVMAGLLDRPEGSKGLNVLHKTISQTRVGLL